MSAWQAQQCMLNLRSSQVQPQYSYNSARLLAARQSEASHSVVARRPSGCPSIEYQHFFGPGQEPSLSDSLHVQRCLTQHKARSISPDKGPRLESKSHRIVAPLGDTLRRQGSPSMSPRLACNSPRLVVTLGNQLQCKESTSPSQMTFDFAPYGQYFTSSAGIRGAASPSPPPLAARYSGPWPSKDAIQHESPRIYPRSAQGFSAYSVPVPMHKHVVRRSSRSPSVERPGCWRQQNSSEVPSANLRGPGLSARRRSSSSGKATVSRLCSSTDPSSSQAYGEQPVERQQHAPEIPPVLHRGPGLSARRCPGSPRKATIAHLRSAIGTASPQVSSREMTAEKCQHGAMGQEGLTTVLGEIEQCRKEWKLRRTGSEGPETMLDNINNASNLEKVAIARNGTSQRRCGSKNLPNGTSRISAAGCVSNAYRQAAQTPCNKTMLPQPEGSEERERVQRLKEMLSHLLKSHSSVPEVSLLDHLLQGRSLSERLIKVLDKMQTGMDDTRKNLAAMDSAHDARSICSQEVFEPSQDSTDVCPTQASVHQVKGSSQELVEPQQNGTTPPFFAHRCNGRSTQDSPHEVRNDLRQEVVEQSHHRTGAHAQSDQHAKAVPQAGTTMEGIGKSSPETGKSHEADKPWTGEDAGELAVQIQERMQDRMGSSLDAVENDADKAIGESQESASKEPSASPPQCGDLVVLLTHGRRAAVVTKVHERHCTVVELDEDQMHGCGECWPEFQRICIESTAWRLGAQVVIQGMRSVKAQTMNGKGGTIIAHPKQGHPCWLTKQSSEKPLLTLCVRFDHPISRKEKSVMVEPRFLVPKENFLQQIAGDLGKIAGDIDAACNSSQAEEDRSTYSESVSYSRDHVAAHTECISTSNVGGA